MGSELSPSAMLQALEESEQRYRQIFETNTAPKLIIDPETGQIVDANDAACRFYGYEKADLIQRSILSINVMPADQIAEEMARAKKEERLYFRFQHRVASGKIREVDVYSGPVNVAGRKLLHSIVIDQTERRQLEQRLLQAQRMETIGLLAGGVAHDFNNLLAAILGSAELARESLAADHPARAHLVDVRSAVERATEITRQLLFMAKKQLVEARYVSIDQVLRSIEPLLRRLLGERAQLELRGSTTRSAWIDPGQLQQVIVNLVVNARDAMPGGGLISLRIGDAEHDGQRWLEIEVQDQGVGIPAALHARIFEPFFTTKGALRGTGLGLATCHVIVEQARGAISVRSEEGQGATFTVRLPAHDERPQQPQRQELEPPRGGTEEILAVEDEPGLLRLIAMTLRGYGYKVHTAENGAQALEQLQGGLRPALVVSDVLMPALRGDELVIKAQALYPELRVLLLSGNPDGMRTTAAFLAKPFLPRQLARAVREALDRRD